MGTNAPWAGGEASGAAPNRHTGKPVQPLISAEPELPPVIAREAWLEQWTPARKRITSVADVQVALKGAALHRFVAFTLSLSEAVAGVRLSDACPVSPAAQALLDALARLSALADDIAPVTHEVRYGNPAFRQWFARMKDAAPEMVYGALGDERAGAMLEILPYWLDSFGNCSRIDYGTGHETAFLAFLYCLFALGALEEQDRQAIVTRVFAAYLVLMRKLQTTYWRASWPVFARR